MRESLEEARYWIEYFNDFYSKFGDYPDNKKEQVKKFIRHLDTVLDDQ